MRNPARFAVLLAALLLLSACGQKSAGLQEGAVAPDKELFENGMNYLDKNQWIKSRLAFQTLISTYPESEYTPIAFLAIADSYYDEGGSENLLQAEAQYKDFIIFYPLHEMADDAQMKIAAINVRLMRAPDRDTTYARKAETELIKLLDTYPDSELAPTAAEILREVQENLATGIHGIGDFYFGKGSYLASESRYKEVLVEYEEYSRLDEVLFRLGESLENLGRIDESSVYYSRLVEGYPFSGLSDSAREKLVLLEKTVPEVNPEEAARNEANRRPEKGFSLLSPIRSVLGIFTGREDPYELAKRRAEERRAAAAGQSGNVPPSDGPPDPDRR